MSNDSSGKKVSAKSSQVTPDMLARGVDACAQAVAMALSILANIQRHGITGDFGGDGVSNADLVKCAEQAVGNLGMVGAALTGAVAREAGLTPEQVPDYVRSIVQLDRAEEQGAGRGLLGGKRSGLPN